MELKMKLEKIATSAGSLGIFDVDNENKVRIVVEQAGPSNVVIVSAKLRGQTDFVELKTFTGDSNGTVNVSTYEIIKVECTVFDAVSESIRVLASSFNEASGSTEVDAPTGGIITDIEVLHFTSSDGSVSIVGSNVTKTLDFTVDFTNFDDVLEFPTLLDFPTVGLVNTIYVAKDTENLYRWSGSVYIEVSPSPVHSVAGRIGDIILDSSDVGLSNVDNTSDALKPISSATQAALDDKVNTSGDVMTGPLNMQGGIDNIEFSVYGLTSNNTIEIKSDNQVTSPSGDVKLTTGDAFGSDYAGSIYLQGGSSVDGNPANIQVIAGQSSGSGANGSIILDSKNVVYLNQNALGSIQASNHRIEYVLDPIENQDAATKIWVEGLSSITNTIIVDASSTTPYPDGSIFKPFPTIAEAIVVATNDTVLIVLPGLYEETKISIPSTLKNLVILGQSRDNTIIKNGVEYIAPADDITVLFEKIDIGQFTLDATYALNGIVSIKQSSVIFDRIDNNFSVVMSITESNIVGGSIAGGPTNINECLILSSPTIFRGLLIVESTKFVQDIAVSGPELVTIRTLDCELFGAPRFISGNSNTIWETDLATDYLGASSSVTKVLLANVPLSSITQSGAILGNVPTWNGTTWIPTTPSGSGGGVTDHTLLTSIGVYPHTSIDDHISSIANPHSTTASQIGLGNVNNTSDINKPVSIATQDALDLKYDITNPSGYISLAEVPADLVTSVNGSVGDVVISKSDIGLSDVDNTSDINKPISTLTQAALDLITDVVWTGDYDNGVTYTVGQGVMYNGASFRMIAAIGAAGYNPAGYPGNWLQVTDYVSPNDIGLGNVDNTTDLNKPISIATQDALDLKFDQPVGTVTDYVAGDGSIQPFPTISTSSNLITEVYNKSGSLIPKFKAIYINGGQGNLPSIVLSQANTEPTSSKTYGVVQSDISDMSNGFVIAQGRLENLDTAALGGTEGTPLWLSPSVAGDITITKPTAPDHVVYMGTIVRSHPTQGVVEIKIQNGFELQELHNVFINGSLADNQVLKYDAPNLLWKSETLVKADVGLDQVDNTSDVNKPVSSATATAISDKVSKTGDTMSGTLDITNSTTGVAAELNNIVVGTPWGSGFSVITVKDGNSDELYLQSADQLGLFSGGVSKQAVLTSGGTLNADTGAVQVISGNPQTSGSSGFVGIASGTATTGNTGAVQVTSGLVTTSGTSGAVVIKSGNSNSVGNTGLARLRTGDSSGGTSGIVEIYTGTAAAASASGYVLVSTGAKISGAASTGLIQLSSGNITGSGTGTSGQLLATTGNSSGGFSGPITLRTGTSASASGTGGITVTTGQKQIGHSASTGFLQLTTGTNAGSGTSGTILVQSGITAGSGNSGSVEVSSGGVSDVNTGSSGALIFRSGSVPVSNSGNITIVTGSAGNAAISGSVYIQTGATAGTRGSVYINSPQLDLQSNKIINTAEFYFGNPNTDGTWRIRPSGANLITEVRQAGVWVTKQTIIA